MNPLLIEGAFELIKSLLPRWFPDPVQKAKAEQDLQDIKQNGDLARLASFTQLAQAQIALNTAEVQSGALLGKWRGGLGWVLAGSLAYQLVLSPIMVATILIFSPAFPVEKLPRLDWKELGSVLLGMLGLGT